jgi:hypothetical protein
MHSFSKNYAVILPFSVTEGCLFHGAPATCKLTSESCLYRTDPLSVIHYWLINGIVKSNLKIIVLDYEAIY